MFSRLQEGAESVLDSVIEMAYFMRGAIPYEEMMRRTPGERQRISEFLKQRLKNEKDKFVPMY